LGGNIAANIVASDTKKFDTGQIRALVLSQPALDLEVANQNLVNSLGGFYDRVFAMGFKEYMTKSKSIEIMRTHFNSKPTNQDFDEALKQSKTLSALNNYLRYHLFGDSKTAE